MEGSWGGWIGNVGENGDRKVWNRRWSITNGTMMAFTLLLIKSDHSDGSCSKAYIAGELGSSTLKDESTSISGLVYG